MVSKVHVFRTSDCFVNPKRDLSFRAMSSFINNDSRPFLCLLAHPANMTHPHTASCLAVVSWATAAPLGASSSSLSLSTFPSGLPVSASAEAAGELSVWAAELDETSFLSWRRQGGR